MTRKGVPEGATILRRATAGQRVYLKKGWRNTAARDAAIRRRHREQISRKHRPMSVRQSVARLAYDFALSEKRIQGIIYS